MKQSQYCIFSFILILLLSVFCFGQEKIRTVGKQFQYNKVIDLVELKIKDRTFKQDEGVPGDKDWIKNLTVRFKNVSAKAICYAEIHLVIQPVGKMKIPLQLNMRYGMPLDLMEFIDKEAIKNYSQKIQPGESFNVSITEFGKKFLDNFIKENQINEIEHADVSPDFIIFENSRTWSVGHEMQQDAEDPALWKVIGSWHEDENIIRKKKL